ncbi:SusD/RagB family nutrient-binding outer membrane lipoprotein [Flaviaesturariibacter aridisoli]|uniref:SusD/RagB family nutrient-binding outer membrane lipoprotein n=1 Tax=Flaviaesturariibacter aridisoli TaxID=2545761 RepID=A0A4R4EAW8_9BACT|nr:SusD/RagB family nutrient-binding outer membrane lipoprotein [Flaviaesturariibacter aridisoli]TCZ75025.1 SusD/RagB family nutrient-binding outer membrane lipoprotein [Flaviaesturariibacter aridisoli]
MNFKNKSFWLLAVSGSLLFGSCKKGFLDVNENPNSPTDLNITPELLFTQAANAVGQRQGSANLTFIMNWLGYTGASGSYALDGTETSYNIDQNFGEGIWANNYNVLYDLYLAKTKALAKGDTVLAGASMILSTKLWQDLVDLFGNIPYKQAFGGGGNPRPGYDAAQSIYNDLQLTLDTAKSYMGRTARTTFAGLDIVNGGNQTNWIRFANTMKLRLLIHQSNVIGATPPTAEITKIMDGGSSLNIIRTAAQSADVNPGYVNEANKQQPFFAAYGFTPANASANEITRANNYVLNELSNNSDPRIARLFTTISGNFIGVDYGLSAGNPTSGAASRFGPGLINNPTSATNAQWIMRHHRPGEAHPVPEVHRADADRSDRSVYGLPPRSGLPPRWFPLGKPEPQQPGYPEPPAPPAERVHYEHGQRCGSERDQPLPEAFLATLIQSHSSAKKNKA